MPTNTTISIEELLQGTARGRMQGVGHMAVIPLVDDGGADESWAPPDVEVSTSGYGTVNLGNPGDRPTIVSQGMGWFTKDAAQDHAVGRTSLIPKGALLRDSAAMCIESNQGGYLRAGRSEMLVLPLALRGMALANAGVQKYDKLWPGIRAFHETLGVQHGRAHLTDFLKQYRKELDEFVAQFELVPGQVGAIVLVGDNVVGIERAPNEAFWQRVWEPLIRVCYGSLAIRARALLGDQVPFWRPSLLGPRPSGPLVPGLMDALAALHNTVGALTNALMGQLLGMQLQLGGTVAVDPLPEWRVTTAGCDEIAGQMVHRYSGGSGVPGKVVHASFFKPYTPNHNAL